MRPTLQAALLAIQFLTRIPVRLAAEPDQAVLRRSLFFFPAVGGLIGLLLYLLWKLLGTTCGLAPLVTAALLVTAETMLTGAFHLDGLADSFDAFGSPTAERDRRLEIMRDSRIGVMGAVALTLALLLKTALLGQASNASVAAGLFFFPLVGRWAQVALYAWLPYVRQHGTGAGFARGADRRILLAASLWLVPLAWSRPALLALAAAIGVLLGYRRYVDRRLGGITGDILGSATVIAELAYLVALLVCL